MTNLGSLGAEWFDTAPVAINQEGLVVGRYQSSSGKYQVFVWRDGMRRVGTLGGAQAQASAHPGTVNEAGQVVGWSATRKRTTHAFVWQDGKLTDLGTAGGIASSAAAINEGGDIVGERRTADGADHAVLWSPRS